MTFGFFIYRDPWISRASRGVRAGLVAREGRVLVRVTFRVQFVGSSRRVSRLRPSRIGTRVPRLARARVPLRCRTSSRRITRRSVLQTRVRTSRVRTPWRPAPGFPRSTRGARTRRRCETFEPNSSRHPAKRRILLLLLRHTGRETVRIRPFRLRPLRSSRARERARGAGAPRSATPRTASSYAPSAKSVASAKPREPRNR